MTIESQRDVDGILNAGRVVAKVRDAMLGVVEPGMTTAELDEIGRKLHEDPEGIVSYYDRGDNRRLHHGQVIAIEPFLSTRSTYVTAAEDGWTLVGHPENRSAQYEHTIIITKGKPIVATRSETSG